LNQLHVKGECLPHFFSYFLVEKGELDSG